MAPSNGERLLASVSRTLAFEHDASPLCRRVAVGINCCAGILPHRVMLVIATALAGGAWVCSRYIAFVQIGCGY